MVIIQQFITNALTSDDFPAKHNVALQRAHIQFRLSYTLSNADWSVSRWRAENHSQCFRVGNAFAKLIATTRDKWRKMLANNLVKILR